MTARQLGENIRKQLDALGMTQRQLASKAGVTEVSVSRYISGEREPKATVLADIAKAMHTTPDSLLLE